MRGKTSTGFEYEVHDKILKDWNVQTALSELAGLEEEDAYKAIPILMKLEKALFKDGGEALHRHILDREGIVDTDAVISAIFDIVKDCGQLKN